MSVVIEFKKKKMFEVGFKNTARNKTNLKMSKPQLNKLEKPTKNLVINTLIPKFKFENNKGKTIEVKGVNLI